MFASKVSALIDFIDYDLVCSNLIYILHKIKDLVHFKTTYGAEVKPLGLCKIKLIDIIGNSIRLNNIKINQAVALRNFFRKLMV